MSVNGFHLTVTLIAVIIVSDCVCIMSPLVTNNISSYCNYLCHYPNDHFCNFNLKSNAVNYVAKPLKLGVEVFDVNLQEMLENFEENIFHKIKSDAHKHRIMVFRNQHNLSPESLLNISMKLGPLFKQPYLTKMSQNVNHPKSPFPEIMRISNDQNEGFTGAGSSGWHIDGAYTEKPFAFLIFYVIQVPTIGDTKFVGFREVMKLFSNEQVNKYDRLYTINTRVVLGKHVNVTQPLVYNHPVTKEKVFCVHLGYVDSFVEENRQRTTFDETTNIKRDITETIESNKEKLVYSHKWMAGDLVIIDNLAVAHKASKESQYNVKDVGLRVLHRVAVMGENKPQKMKIAD